MNVKSKEELYKIYLSHAKLVKMRAELHRRLSKKLNQQKDIENLLDKYVDMQVQVNFSRRSLVRIAMSKNIEKQDFNIMMDEFGRKAMEDYNDNN